MFLWSALSIKRMEITELATREQQLLKHEMCKDCLPVVNIDTFIYLELLAVVKVI
jgi:hypothetical protein